MAQLVLFVGFVALWFPAVRHALYSLGLILTWAAIIGFVVALGVYLIRRSERRSPFSSAPSTTLRVTASIPQRIELKSPAPTGDRVRPAATAEQILRTERWSPFSRDASRTLDVTTSLPQRSELTSAPVADRARPATTAELIEELRAIDWFQFEKLVASVYRKLGYTVTRRGGANADGGIDLVIEKDGQRSAVQCKQWKTWKVGVKAVREFLGALTHAGIQKGVFITLNGYSGDAKQLAGEHGIEIVNQTGLARMLESIDAKSDPETLSILRDKRKFCPKCEREMVVRTTAKGPGAGNRFWGCSTFPRCRFMMPI